MKQFQAVELILESFEANSFKYDTAMKDLNPKSANTYAKRIINAYLQLRELGEVNALEKFCDAPNLTLRVWAATHLLQTNERLAINALKEISRQPGLLGLSAKTTLEEWEKGTLDLAYTGMKAKW